jgi:hypothetical protein
VLEEADVEDGQRQTHVTEVARTLRQLAPTHTYSTQREHEASEHEPLLRLQMNYHPSPPLAPFYYHKGLEVTRAKGEKGGTATLPPPPAK